MKLTDVLQIVVKLSHQLTNDPKELKEHNDIGYTNSEIISKNRTHYFPKFSSESNKGRMDFSFFVLESHL